MPKLPTVAVLLLATLLVHGCSGGTEGQDREGDITEFAHAAVRVLGQIEGAHTVLADPEVNAMPADRQESRYAALEEEMRRAREELGSIEVTGDLAELRTLFDSLLVKERDIWVHMVLFARTGQELHRVLANELLADGRQITQTAVQRLRQDLVAAGVDAQQFGLDAYLASHTAASTDARAAPTALVASRPSPTPHATTAPTPTAGPPEAPATVQPLAATPTPTSEAKRPSAPTPTPSRQVDGTSTPTPEPTRTPTAFPIVTATALAAPTPTPSPTVTPVLMDGDLLVIRFPDRKGNPAYIAHWTVHVEPRTVAYIEYPFLSGDDLEISMFLGIDELDSTLRQAYLEAPDGERLVELSDFSRSWNGDAVTRSSGTHRAYFDNSDGDVPKVMHVLITYHRAAPGAIIPR